MKKLPALMFSAVMLAAVSASAQVRVEIAGVASNQIPIAIAAFADEGVAPDQVSAIVNGTTTRAITTGLARPDQPPGWLASTNLLDTTLRSSYQPV